MLVSTVLSAQTLVTTRRADVERTMENLEVTKKNMDKEVTKAHDDWRELARVNERFENFLNKRDNSM